MGLLGKKETAAAVAKSGARPEKTGVLVLGSGCAKCNALEEAVRAALTELGMDSAVGHVTDFTQIAAYGVTYWLPLASAANIGQAGAALAVALKTRDVKIRSLALPSSLSGDSPTLIPFSILLVNAGSVRWGM